MNSRATFCGLEGRHTRLLAGHLHGASLSDVARLDTMVTVVDAVNLLKDYGSRDFLRDRGKTAGDGDARTLVDLLVDQIEFADVVV